MKTKERKYFQTLAADLKARRKRKLTESEITELNKIFEFFDNAQSKKSEKRKIARQPEA